MSPRLLSEVTNISGKLKSNQNSKRVVNSGKGGGLKGLTIIATTGHLT